MKKLIIPSAEPFFYPGEKTGCVLVHGFTGTPKEMRMMGDYLKKSGVTCIGIRLAGHATQISDIVRTRWNDWLASVEDGINFLSNFCDDIFIAGLSMGGILALIAAYRYPINGAIAMSTPYKISNDWRIKFAKQISFLRPYIKKERSNTGNKKKSKNHIDYTAYPTRSIAELNQLIEVLHMNLHKIDIPILLINSKNDRKVPISDMEHFRREINSDHLEIVTLEKSGHVITEDVEKNVVFKTTLDFIQRYTK